MVKKDLREKAREMRRQGFSVNQIANELNVSKGSVSVWVRDIVLTNEQKSTLKAQQKQWGENNKGSQKNRQAAIQQRIAYQQLGREKAHEGSRLHLIGCMLYWAEGAKARNFIHFVNSDPHMMTIFRRFLDEELKVENSEMSLQIHCHTHDKVEQNRISEYWLKLLQLPEQCLLNIQVKEGSKTSSKVLHNGVCAIRVYRTDIAMHIYGAIQEYAGFENPAWLF